MICQCPSHLNIIISHYLSFLCVHSAIFSQSRTLRHYVDLFQNTHTSPNNFHACIRPMFFRLISPLILAPLHPCTLALMLCFPGAGLTSGRSTRQRGPTRTGGSTQSTFPTRQRLCQSTTSSSILCVAVAGSEDRRALNPRLRDGTTAILVRTSFCASHA